MLGGQPAPGPRSSGYRRPSMTNLGVPSPLGWTYCGQRLMASTASVGFSATCPSASMIRIGYPCRIFERADEYLPVETVTG
ncbi:hypothetical protein I553_6280 [Mycobacterium xenopi 4042]|uniref:Uncharacterized protein n=1 Tax=Mycobacterium xenopi 4042 TaxID=1299334 RepID=X8BH79_MYCXE|nr:hypothetical protein I553_6280 [Mycobacterium xenopi 4042]